MKKLCFTFLILLFYGCPGDYLKDELTTITYNRYSPIFKPITDYVKDIQFESSKPVDSLGKIYLYKNYMFVNKPYEGIHIIDITDKSNPENIGFLKILGNVDIAIKEDVLYADCYSALVAVDITDIQNPKVIGNRKGLFYYNLYSDPNYFKYQDAVKKDNGYEHYFDSNRDVIYDDGSEYILAGWQFVETYDETYYTYDDGVVYEDSQAEIKTNSSSEGTGGSMARFSVISSYLYALNRDKINILDISDKNEIIEWGKVHTNQVIETVFRLDQILYVGSQTGMLMYDITDESNPLLLSTVSHFQSCDPVVSDGAYAYVTLRGGNGCGRNNSELQIYDVSNPKNPRQVSSYILNEPYGLGIYQDELFVCDGNSGLKVFDVSDRNIPKVKSFDSGINPYDIIITYPYAYLITNTGLNIYDISDANKIVKLSQI